MLYVGIYVLQECPWMQFEEVAPNPPKCAPSWLLKFYAIVKGLTQYRSSIL